MLTRAEGAHGPWRELLKSQDPAAFAHCVLVPLINFEDVIGSVEAARQALLVVGLLLDDEG